MLNRICETADTAMSILVGIRSDAVCCWDFWCGEAVGHIKMESGHEPMTCCGEEVEPGVWLVVVGDDIFTLRRDATDEDLRLAVEALAAAVFADVDASWDRILN